MTKRQKSYQAYLKTDHWKRLRAMALERDSNACVICLIGQELQVHHKFYRGRPEDTMLEDLETLCRKHHRLTHGLGPTDFESKARQVMTMFNYQKRPSVADWKELKSLIECDYDLADFADVMFQYIRSIVANEREHWQNGWWMDDVKNHFWFKRAHNVRKSIKERILKNVR